MPETNDSYAKQYTFPLEKRVKKDLLLRKSSESRKQKVYYLLQELNEYAKAHLSKNILFLTTDELQDFLVNKFHPLPDGHNQFSSYRGILHYYYNIILNRNIKFPRWHTMLILFKDRIAKDNSNKSAQRAKSKAIKPKRMKKLRYLKEMGSEKTQLFLYLYYFKEVDINRILSLRKKNFLSSKRLLLQNYDGREEIIYLPLWLWQRISPKLYQLSQNSLFFTSSDQNSLEDHLKHKMKAVAVIPQQAVSSSPVAIK